MESDQKCALTLAPLRLVSSASSTIPVAHDKNLAHVESELRAVRKGDINGLFAVLDNHFPSSRVAMAENNNNGEDEPESKRIKKSDPWKEQMSLFQIHLASFEHLPPELLFLIFKKLLFDGRWVIGMVMYKERPVAGHRALDIFHAFVVKSLGGREEFSELEDGQKHDAAVDILSTLHEFIYDVAEQDTLTEDEKLWFNLGGLVDTGLPYSIHYPEEYMQLLSNRVEDVFDELKQKKNEGMLESVMTTLKIKSIDVMSFFDQLSIFLKEHRIHEPTYALPCVFPGIL